mmetsp:Transcript_3095/g.5856  ORF Transcript_3095/g.5856 Transcript_3095/m.5856 type:complete len:428 (+) Transcript_3095:234-1517(+)
MVALRSFPLRYSASDAARKTKVGWLRAIFAVIATTAFAAFYSSSLQTISSLQRNPKPKVLETVLEYVDPLPPDDKGGHCQCHRDFEGNPNTQASTDHPVLNAEEVVVVSFFMGSSPQTNSEDGKVEELPQRADLTSLVQHNHKMFAGHQGYRYEDCSSAGIQNTNEQTQEQGSHLDWVRPFLGKLACLRYAMHLPRARWVLWLDSDAVVVDMHRRLQPMLDPSVHFIVSHGRGHLVNHWINTGVFLAQTTPWAHEFVNHMTELLKQHDFRQLHPDIPHWRDQKAFLIQMLRLETFQYIKLLPPECGHLLQTFPPFVASDAAPYHLRDFVVHFPGEFKDIDKLWQGVLRQMAHHAAHQNGIETNAQKEFDEQAYGAPIISVLKFNEYMNSSLKLAEYINYVETHPDKLPYHIMMKHHLIKQYVRCDAS